MIYKKMFFPIGGGEELTERIYGALLIAKYFKSHLEILKTEVDPSTMMPINIKMSDKIEKEIKELHKTTIEEGSKIFQELLNGQCNAVGIKQSLKPISSEATVSLITKAGFRSKLVEQESKYCDIVIAAAPPNGITTATFETSVLKSGKCVIMFPRIMKTFSTESILIGWNNSTEASRAVSNAIPLLKEARRVEIVSSSEYTKDLEKLDRLVDYLSFHDIKASYKIVQTTRKPGEALLNNAINGEFDMIVAGAYGHQGLKELMFGGATRFLLEHASIPVFMSH